LLNQKLKEAQQELEGLRETHQDTDCLMVSSELEEVMLYLQCVKFNQLLITVNKVLYFLIGEGRTAQAQGDLREGNRGGRDCEEIVGIGPQVNEAQAAGYTRTVGPQRKGGHKYYS
jgi:hypothetical protein